jgi:hypothetical protein
MKLSKMKSPSLILAVYIILASSCDALSSVSTRGNVKTSLVEAKRTAIIILEEEKNDIGRQQDRNASSRRGFLGFASVATAMMIGTTPANARDEVFRTNPLTNGLLEQVS